MYQNTQRHEFRQLFSDVLLKMEQGLPLTPMESQIAEVIQIHPEYHSMLSLLNKEENLHKDYTPEMGQTNPFLHLALHLGIRDQIRLDRPTGVRTLYQQLIQEYSGDLHHVEHLFMECLAEVLHTAQVNHSLPDEKAYFEKLTRLSSSMVLTHLT
jgi:hypothetical protein